MGSSGHAGTRHDHHTPFHKKVGKVNVSTFDAARRAMQSGDTTCEKLTEHFLQEAAKGRHLNAVLSLFGEEALDRARRVDRKINDGTAGPLAGMVVAVKDILAMKDEKVTCASKILESFVSPYNATVVQRLIDADAVIIAKTNMDEFAMGSSSEYSAFGPVLNPVDNTRVPGGSTVRRFPLRPGWHTRHWERIPAVRSDSPRHSVVSSA
jgi:aspartyl-tRNA(Asn)/glutamyl-tRNA(Gln) amidotransferase subunit A